MSSNDTDTVSEEVPVVPEPVLSFEELQQKQEEELEHEREEAPDIKVPEQVHQLVGRPERRGSRESSEGDLVHVSELSSINNGNSPPASGEATPKSENQQVNLKFERRDSKGSATKPQFATRQRRDVKEPGYDDKVEDTIQVKKTSYLTKQRDSKDKGTKKQSILMGIECVVGVALVAAAVGAIVYFKYR